MIKKFIFLFIILLATQILYSKKPLAAYKIDSLWYFIDYSGTSMFDPIPLNDVKDYSEGLFLVSKLINGNEQWGFLDTNGNFTIFPKFIKANPFSQGYALVYIYTNSSDFPYQVNFIDKNGKFLLQENVIDATDFSESKAYIMRQNRTSAYIDTNGNLLFEINNYFGTKFKENKAVVLNTDYRAGFIDSSGKFIIDFKYDNAKNYSEDLAAAYFIDKFGFIDTTGEFVIEAKYDYTLDFKYGRAFVGISNKKAFKTKWGLIDKNGHTIVDFTLNKIWEFSDDSLAAVQNDEGWGFIDINGKWFIEPKFYFAGNFIDGIAWVTTKDKSKSGYINKNGKFIIEINNFEKIIDLRMNKRMF